MIVLAQASLTGNAVGVPVVLASLSLVVLAVGLGRWLGLGIERQVIEASVRAALQLLAVGLLFSFIFTSAGAVYWAWVWVAVMVTVSSIVVSRRANHVIPRLRVVTAATIAASALISIAVSFGFGVIDYSAVALVVVAGITIGNAVPSTVLGVNQAVNQARDRTGELEALLSLGLDRRQVVRFLAPGIARTALIPQVERTKVVGLIALPGAMTGLLLAGVDPIEAVVVQLLVMYLVLGTVAVCVVAVVTAVTRASVTERLVVADWARRGSQTGS